MQTMLEVLSYSSMIEFRGEKLEHSSKGGREREKEDEMGERKKRMRWEREKKRMRRVNEGGQSYQQFVNKSDTISRKVSMTTMVARHFNM